MTQDEDQGLVEKVKDGVEFNSDYDAKSANKNKIGPDVKVGVMIKTKSMIGHSRYGSQMLANKSMK